VKQSIFYLDDEPACLNIFQATQNTRTDRKIDLRALFVALTFASSALLFAANTNAQTPAPQAHDAAQPQKDDEPDLINPDRPGIADGSAVIGAKRVQIESGVQAEFRRDGETREHTLFIPMLVRVGLSKRFEARVEGNTFTRVSEIDPLIATTHTDGVAPTSVGFKFQIEDSKGVRHPSLGTIVRVFPASGTGDFHTQHATGDVRLAADWDFAPRLKLSLNPNVGVGRYEDGQGKTFAAALFAVTLNYLPTKKLNPFVDMGVQSPEESDGESSVTFDTGLAYIVGHNIQLDASIGTGTHGHTPPHPFVGFGVSFRSKKFGKHI
jgi:hypothetical protein